jgi:ketosteroid isomerase-like protein
MLLEQYTGNIWTVVWAPVTNASSTEGNVILTCLPVVGRNTYRVHATGDYTLLDANRSVAQATVRVGRVDVNVFSTHLDYYSTSYRSTQEQQLMSWALNFGGPRLVDGDFNSRWGEYRITNMMTEYTDTWQDYTGSNQNGYTVNNSVRFDYIFRSMDGGWRVTPITRGSRSHRCRTTIPSWRTTGFSRRHRTTLSLHNSLVLNPFDLLTRTYAAFNSRDIDRALEALHPDVEWPNGMSGGYEHGRDAVRAYWTKQWTQIDPRVDPVAMDTDEQGRIVVHVHQVVRDLAGTVIADRMVRHIYTVVDGLVTHMEIAP